MKKPDRLKLGAVMGIAAALIFYAGTGAWAQLDTDVPGGHLKIQTALETDWGCHTAGKDNRNNNNNNIPGSGQGFSTDGDDVQAAVGRIDPLITFRARDDVAEAMGLDDADLYLHLRLLGGRRAAYQWSERLRVRARRVLHARPVARYPGDAWSARISEHEYEADANEAYIDLRKGPFALRLGKQQVVYGEELGVQTLDQVDSLDFTKFQASSKSARWNTPMCASVNGRPRGPISFPISRRWESTTRLSPASSAPTSSPTTSSASASS